MVRLEEPVDDQLPVQRLAEDVGPLAHVAGHPEAGELAVELAEVGRHIDVGVGRRTRDRPHETVPFLDRHRDETVLLTVDGGEPVVVRDRAEPACCIVRPGVVRAREPTLAPTAAQLDRRPAMGAHVVEPAQDAVVAAHDQQRSARQVVHDEVARRPEVAGMRDDDRIVGEQTRPLETVVLGIDVPSDGVAHDVLDHRIDARIELGVDPVHQVTLPRLVHQPSLHETNNANCIRCVASRRGGRCPNPLTRRPRSARPASMRDGTRRTDGAGRGAARRGDRSRGRIHRPPPTPVR